MTDRIILLVIALLLAFIALLYAAERERRLERAARLEAEALVRRLRVMVDSAMKAGEVRSQGEHGDRDELIQRRP